MDKVQKSLNGLKAVAERRVKNDKLSLILQEFTLNLEDSFKEPCEDGSMVEVGENDYLLFLEILKRISINEGFLQEIPVDRLQNILKVMRPRCDCPSTPDCPRDRVIGSFIESFAKQLNQ